MDYKNGTLSYLQNVNRVFGIRDYEFTIHLETINGDIGIISFKDIYGEMNVNIPECIGVFSIENGKNIPQQSRGKMFMIIWSKSYIIRDITQDIELCQINQKKQQSIRGDLLQQPQSRFNGRELMDQMIQAEREAKEQEQEQEQKR